MKISTKEERQEYLSQHLAEQKRRRSQPSKHKKTPSKRKKTPTASQEAAQRKMLDSLAADLRGLNSAIEDETNKLHKLEEELNACFERLRRRCRNTQNESVKQLQHGDLSTLRSMINRKSRQLDRLRKEIDRADEALGQCLADEEYKNE